MTLDCPCGGRLVRTDIVGAFDERYGRVMYSDTDPDKCNWKCDKCGLIKTQRKRRKKEVVKEG